MATCKIRPSLDDCAECLAMQESCLAMQESCSDCKLHKNAILLGFDHAFFGRSYAIVSINGRIKNVHPDRLYDIKE